VIDTISSLPPILHRFRDIAFDRSKFAIWLPVLLLTAPTEGFPLSYHRKLYIAKN